MYVSCFIKPRLFHKRVKIELPICTHACVFCYFVGFHWIICYCINIYACVLHTFFKGTRDSATWPPGLRRKEFQNGKVWHGYFNKRINILRCSCDWEFHPCYVCDTRGTRLRDHLHKPNKTICFDIMSINLHPNRPRILSPPRPPPLLRGNIL